VLHRPSTSTAPIAGSTLNTIDAHFRARADDASRDDHAMDDHDSSTPSNFKPQQQ
jgi:hypothetical protein